MEDPEDIWRVIEVSSSVELPGIKAPVQHTRKVEDRNTECWRGSSRLLDGLGEYVRGYPTARLVRLIGRFDQRATSPRRSRLQEPVVEAFLPRTHFVLDTTGYWYSANGYNLLIAAHS